MIKLKDSNVGFDGELYEDEIIVDTSGEFSIQVRFEKSNSLLEEADSILVETFDATNIQFGFWSRGSLKVEQVEEETQ